tara:strand:- start:493 stop:723 length:231 start_codon:yes stop_codon:yes gene_type:complete
MKRFLLLVLTTGLCTGCSFYDKTEAFRKHTCADLLAGKISLEEAYKKLDIPAEAKGPNKADQYLRLSVFCSKYIKE